MFHNGTQCFECYIKKRVYPYERYTVDSEFFL